MRIIKMIGRVFGIALTALLVFLLISNIYTIGVRKITGEKQPGVFGFSSAVVVSGSMSGSVEVNDMVIIHQQDDYAVGDVITFDSGSSLVTHRIVEKNEQGFVTRGDANNTNDADIVSKEQIIGRVVFVIPKIGVALGCLKTPAGFLSLVLIGILAFGVNLLADRRGETGGKKNGNEKNC